MGLRFTARSLEKFRTAETLFVWEDLLAVPQDSHKLETKVLLHWV